MDSSLGRQHQHLYFACLLCGDKNLLLWLWKADSLPPTSPRCKGVILGQAATATQKLSLSQPHTRLHIRLLCLPCLPSCPRLPQPPCSCVSNPDCRLSKFTGTNCSRPRGHIGVPNSHCTELYRSNSHVNMETPILKV